MEILLCRVCKSKNLTPFFDLGNQPLANSLLKSPQQKENSYPLCLTFCKNCNLVQLTYTADPKVLFSQYVWVTGTSKTAQEFAYIFCEMLIKKAGKQNKGRVLEIASNDGTFLFPFIQKGYTVLGIDPAKNIAEIANKNNIPTETLFFGDKTAKRIIKKYGKSDIVFARNVLPHVSNTRDFVQGLYTTLNDDGLLAIEVHYAKIILEELHYDSIYHEHLCYFTLKTLERLLNEYNLYIFDINKSPISGGSIIIYAKKQKLKEAATVKKYIEHEKRYKINDYKTWKEFAEKSQKHKEKLLTLLHRFAKKNTTIIGYGASARSSTLLNFCGITKKILPLIADQNPLKQNLFTPGTHIKIVDADTALATKPSGILLLAWNFTVEVLEILQKKYQYKGTCIIPLPNSPKVKKL